jgi:glycogen debranching enzyme
MGMKPDEIFQLIIKADERLKYATDQRAASRREQAKALLQQALEAAQEIGNNALTEQAQRRLSDLEALEEGEDPQGTSAAADAPPELGGDAIQVLEGSTFMISDARGDVPPGAVAGLFHEDTRFLSTYALTVGGATPRLLTSSQVDYYSAAFFLTNPDIPPARAEALTIQRVRFVGDGLHDDVILRSHSPEPMTVEVRLRMGADFADLFEVKQKGFRKEGTYSTSHQANGRLRFEYRHERFHAATVIEPSQEARVEDDDLVFDVVLEPRGTWKTCVIVRLHLDDHEFSPVTEDDAFVRTKREAGMVLKKWQDEVPRLNAGRHLLQHVYQRSIVDLAALRLYADVEGNEYSLPAAGLPWFMAIFGRDTLITSLQSVWVGPELARGALTALASLQGTEENDFKDEDPGKILHEIRFGELTALGLKPHRPYYGSADATPLWLILLSEYWRFTGDADTCHDLWPHATRALEWIDRYGDRDRDGYVEYRTRSPQGLDNQCWKDSWDGVRFADGRLAQAPIATCEIQGYVYDAKLRTAELAERVWGDPALATRLRAEAEELRRRFNEDFWIDERGGYYAFGLDADKQQIDALTSNTGHLLWSGIVPDERAGAVRDRLLSNSLFSGWGVRTMSTEDAAFNPIGYHLGTVWPHDNSLIAAGLARAGFREEANAIAMAMFDAAAFTDYRLPEVFAGYPRQDSRFPIRYPTACSPQAWATAAPFLWLRVLLGLEAREGEIVCDPLVPDDVGSIRLHGVHAFGGHFDVEATGTDGSVSPTH